MSVPLLYVFGIVLATAGAQFVPGTDTGCSVTPRDTLGPYYLAGSPVSHTMCLGTSDDEYLLVKGTVSDIHCLPVHNANVEVWQADPSGVYHDDRCRVQFPVDHQGEFSFVTIMPGKYLQGYYYRPAHIHFRVTAPGYQNIVTQMYFADDSQLGVNDPCGTCNSDSLDLIMDVSAPTADDMAQITQLVNFPVNKVVDFGLVMGHK